MSESPETTRRAELPYGVLLVSARGDFFHVLEEMLRQTGESVFTARSSAPAWARMRSGLIGCVVLDLVPPDLDALALFRVARSTPATADIPFLFLVPAEYQPATLDASDTEVVCDAWLSVALLEEQFSLQVTRLLQHLAYGRLRLRQGPPASSGGESRAGRSHSGGTTVSSAGIDVFSGRLEAIDVPKILGMLEPLGLSGQLVIREKHQEVGRICFVKGAVWHAQAGDQEGSDALFLLFKKTKGSFQFRPVESAQRRTIMGNTMSLLLEHMRQTDELRRLEEPAPDESAAPEAAPAEPTPTPLSVTPASPGRRSRSFETEVKPHAVPLTRRETRNLLRRQLDRVLNRLFPVDEVYPLPGRSDAAFGVFAGEVLDPVRDAAKKERARLAASDAPPLPPAVGPEEGWDLRREAAGGGTQRQQARSRLRLYCDGMLIRLFPSEDANPLPSGPAAVRGEVDEAFASLVQRIHNERTTLEAAGTAR